MPESQTEKRRKAIASRMYSPLYDKFERFLPFAPPVSITLVDGVFTSLAGFQRRVMSQLRDEYGQLPVGRDGRYRLTRESARATFIRLTLAGDVLVSMGPNLKVRNESATKNLYALFGDRSGAKILPEVSLPLGAEITPPAAARCFLVDSEPGIESWLVPEYQNIIGASSDFPTMRPLIISLLSADLLASETPGAVPVITAPPLTTYYFGVPNADIVAEVYSDSVFYNAANLYNPFYGAVTFSGCPWLYIKAITGAPPWYYIHFSGVPTFDDVGQNFYPVIKTKNRLGESLPTSFTLEVREP